MDYMDMDNEANDETKCAVCSLPAGKSCSACFTVSYCSVEHQKSHWKKHKENCNAYKVETNEELGLHLVASRDLKAGTLVLKENPIASGPKVPYLGNDDPILVCLGCYCIMMNPLEALRKCSKCKWPVCSISCEKKPHHAENECELLAKNNIPHPGNSNDEYYNIFILRICLLKHKDLSSWKGVMKLQHESKFNNNVHSCQRTKEKVQKIVEFFKITDKVSAEEWLRVSNTADINTLGMNINYHSGKGQPSRCGLGSILPLKGSMLSHSCAPNCTWGVTPPAKDMKLQVRTTVDVIKGEILAIAYNAQWNLIGTAQRRKTIQNFMCKCSRCTDPTELGSNASTMVCNKCKMSALASTDPLDDNVPWKCDSCGYVELNGLRIVSDVVKIFDMIGTCRDTKDTQYLVTKYSGKHYHPNHWVMTEATRKLVKYLGDVRSSEFTNQERQLYISSCKHLLRVANITAPGISKERAHLQHLIAKETVNYAMQEYSKKNLTLVEFQKLIRDAEQLQEEAYKYFKTDCSEAGDGGKGPVALYLEDQMKLVKFIYRGTFTM